MILLTVEEIIELHDKLIDRTGGSHGLRDQSHLSSQNVLAVFFIEKIKSTLQVS